MKNIAVLVSGGGTNLQALIDAQGRGELINGRITAVISSTPSAYALERAKAAGIPGYVAARKDVYKRQVSKRVPSASNTTPSNSFLFIPSRYRCGSAYPGRRWAWPPHRP